MSRLPTAPPSHGAIALPSGRSVVVQAEPEELVEVRAADGSLELRITLTPQGPVVHVAAARLSLEATEHLSLRAPRVDIVATEAITLQSDGTLSLAAAHDAHLRSDGEVYVAAPLIHLN